MTALAVPFNLVFNLKALSSNPCKAGEQITPSWLHNIWLVGTIVKFFAGVPVLVVNAVSDSYMSQAVQWIAEKCTDFVNWVSGDTVGNLLKIDRLYKLGTAAGGAGGVMLLLDAFGYEVDRRISFYLVAALGFTALMRAFNRPKTATEHAS